jgi:hypothetical protein
MAWTPLKICFVCRTKLLKEEDHSLFVYFAYSPEMDLIKIGLTKNVESRAKALQRGVPYTVKILKSFRGSFYHEQYLHAKFEHLRIKNEWFKNDTEIISFLEGLEDGDKLILSSLIP